MLLMQLKSYWRSCVDARVEVLGTTVGFGYAKPAARFDLDAGQLVPAPQLSERNAEAICNGDQRIAAAHGVEPRVRGRRKRRRNRHHQSLQRLRDCRSACS